MTPRRPHNVGFSPRQQADYRPVVAKAWLARCGRLGIFPNERGAKDAWYRDELMECLGENTTGRCNQTTDFDIAIRHFAQIAGDEYWTTRIADGPERRLRFLIEQRLSQMGQIDGGTYTWTYAVGIFRHMFPGASAEHASMDDCPAKILRKVFIALDRQAARLRARYAAAAKANKDCPF